MPNTNYKYSSLTPEDRKKWLQKRAVEQNRVSIDKSGNIWYTAPDQYDRTAGLQDLFNVPKNEIKTVKLKDGSTKYKVDNVFELEPVEQKYLKSEIEEFKIKNLDAKDRKRFDWFQKHKDNISVSNGKVFYKAEKGTTLYGMGLLFDKNPKNIRCAKTYKAPKVVKPNEKYFVDRVKNLDSLERKFLFPDAPTIELSEKGADYIKKRENAKLNSRKTGFIVYHCKADSAEVLTVAHGHAEKHRIEIDGKYYYKNDVISFKQGDILFDEDTTKFINKIQNKLKNGDLTQNQQDALISYAFNTGGEKLVNRSKHRKVTFIDLINKKDFGACQGKFNIITADGKPCEGLINRRIEELGIFSNGYLSKEGKKVLEYMMKKGDMKEKYIREIMTNLRDYGIKNADGYEKTLWRFYKKYN